MRARTEGMTMPSEKMRTRAREWLYNVDHPNETASQQEVDDLATLLDEVCVADEMFQKSLALAAALDVPREVVPADITTLIEQRDVAWRDLETTVKRFAADLKARIERAAVAFDQPGQAERVTGMRYVLGIVDAALSDYDVRDPGHL
jgi:hypothetical protein